MKMISFFSLLLLVSCGDVGPANKAGEGDRVIPDPQPISTDEQVRFNTVCNAIDYKTSRLDADTRQFVFSYSTQSCEKGSEAVKTQIVADIEETRSSTGAMLYTFMPIDRKPYVFKEIETSDTGNIRKVCEVVRSMSDVPRSPIVSANGATAIWYTGTGETGCETDANHICVQLIFGSSEDGGASFVRHTREVYRIRTTVGDEYRGFYMMRAKYASIGCEEGKNVYKTTLTSSNPAAF